MMTLSSILRLFFFVFLIVTMIIRTFDQESLINMKALLNKVLTLDVSAQHDDIVDRVRAQIITNTRCGRCPENDCSDYDNDSFFTITVLPGKAEPIVQWIGNPSHHRLIILYSEKVNEANKTKSILFRSHENGSMVNETYKLQPGAVIDSIFTSKNADKLIFRDMVNCSLYVTTNGGDNYTYCDCERCLQFTPSIIQFSDNNEKYLFAIDNTTASHSVFLAHDTCPAENLTVKGLIYPNKIVTSDFKLYVSTQPGRNDSWKKLSTKVESAYWTQLKDGQDFDDPTAIYFTEQNGTSGGCRIIKAVNPYLNYSECEFCQNIKEVTNFKLAYEYIFVTKNVDNISRLFVSYKRQSFVRAKFIPEMDSSKQYSVVDASQGQVILAVLKDNTTADLYISDEWGTNYSLSLRNIITNNLQWNSGIESFDFYKVKGTNGTYVANVAVINSNQSYQTTVISFNKGAKWSPVTAPTLDSDMLPVECYFPDCSLHLDIHNSGIVSKKSAVGMIIARGTLGKRLGESVGLYVSYDGGFSWRELFKTDAASATFLFDILDSGSIILVANKSGNFMISCDAGFKWEHHDIHADNCLYADNWPKADNSKIYGLYTEMSDTASLATLLYGSSEFTFKGYVVINLNMSQLNISKCEDRDYITWMPSDRRVGDRCVLGEKLKYHKRKLKNCCQNKPNYWIPLDSKPVNCGCTIEDFSCDVGFEHIDYNSPCTPVDNYNFAPTIYNYGYRRIPGDKCVAKRNSYFYNELHPCSRRTEGSSLVCEASAHVETNRFNAVASACIWVEWVPVVKELAEQKMNIQILNFDIRFIPTVFGLYVNATPSPAAVNQPITFNVTVNDRHQFEGTYYFLYGDNSHENSTANIVKHSYSVPGYFSVKIIVSTATGNSSTTIGVFVENEIVDANVSMLHWNLCYLFAVTILYNKTGEADYYRSNKYIWNFTSCSLETILSITTSSPMLKYEFSNAECYYYDLWVYNAVSSVCKQGNLSGYCFDICALC